MLISFIFGGVSNNVSALVVTADGFTQSSGRYTGISSDGGRVCGLQLCNLVVENLKSSNSLAQGYERIEDTKITPQERLDKMLSSDLVQALLAKYAEHRDQDVLVSNNDDNIAGTYTAGLFANPIKPSIPTLMGGEQKEKVKFIVVLPDYIARYAPGYANPDYPTYPPVKQIIDLIDSVQLFGNSTMIATNSTMIATNSTMIVEIMFDGKLSALSTTKAKFWFFDTGVKTIVVLVSELKELVKKFKTVKFTATGDTKQKEAYLIKQHFIEEICTRLEQG